MHVFRGFHHKLLAARTALTIGNFDGVHRGHQAMLHQLVQTARFRALTPTVLTFEPHPRDFFATLQGHAESAPSHISTLRDKLCALGDAGVQQVVVLRFDQHLAALSPADFVARIVLDGLKARYVLIGDDFRFGAKRAGHFEQLDRLMREAGAEAQQMPVVTETDLRISSSAVREALKRGDMQMAERLLGRPYAISGHVMHGAKLGRQLGFPTLNLRFDRARPALGGIFVARVFGLHDTPLPAVASLGTRPAIEDQGRVLLETHVFDWRGDAYGKLIRVELLHKLRDEAHYPDLDQLTAAIQHDSDQARAWFAQLARQTTRDRI
ncbi:MAG: bifunctional riboflavin kinase/FAD synthetase [Pseudomonadota bacterium]